MALPEYIADCDPTPGEPTLILLGLSTAARNVRFGDTGANVSLSVDWWDGFERAMRKPSSGSSESESYPGTEEWEVLSKAGLPRMVLVGHLEEISRAEVERYRVAECFLGRHGDARGWEPGRRGAAHEGVWVRVRVKGIYWIGGFGDRAWIGWLDGEEYKGVEEGEWRGVRLPGEEA